MKIGILTFHRAYNYGAVLQAYATQEYLKQMGHDVEIVDYMPNYFVERNKLIKFGRGNLISRLKSFVISLLLYRRSVEKANKINCFIDSYFSLSPIKYLFPFSANYDYDAFIVGSDQVWNPDITNGFDSVFWGRFKIKDGAKIISYAASMSQINLPDFEKECVSKLLVNFTSISVRESELALLMQPLVEKKISVVLDPTLLIDSAVWHKLAVRPTLDKPYLLVYTVSKFRETMKMARVIAAERGLSIVVLSGIGNGYNKNEYFVSPSPEEFVGWFMCADFVLTSSFHGTAFSLIFNKSFYSVSNGTKHDSRQRTLLSSLTLAHRIVSPDQLPTFSMIDYTAKDVKMEDIKKQSIGFIRDSLT